MTATDTRAPEVTNMPETGAKEKGFIRRHLFLWFFLAVQAMFIAWLATGIGGNADAMAGPNGDAAQVGTAIGAGLIFALWVGVDVILGIGRFVVVTARRR